MTKPDDIRRRLQDILSRSILSDLSIQTDTGIWGSPDGFQTNASTSSSVPSLDAIKAIGQKLKAKQEEDDRKVFVFDGTAEEFYEACRRQGIKDITGSLLPGYDSSLCGLQVEEIGGRVFIGTRTALKRFLDPATILTDADRRSLASLGDDFLDRLRVAQQQERDSC